MTTLARNGNKANTPNQHLLILMKSTKVQTLGELRMRGTAN